MTLDFDLVDAHQHFWDPLANYHPWLRDEPPTRPFAMSPPAGAPSPSCSEVNSKRASSMSLSMIDVCGFELQMLHKLLLLKLLLRMLPLLHFNYSAINPVAVKSLMKAVGLPVGALRKPLTGLEGEALMKGVRIVQELGLDKKYGWKVKPVSAIAAE